METFNSRIDTLKEERMIHGEKTHGRLDLRTDPRDFILEGIEELVDFLNYLEFAMLQGRIGFCKWLQVDRDIRFTIWRISGEKDAGEESRFAFFGRSTFWDDRSLLPMF